ncbi:hypothetical protein GCM10010168_48910 [Actinoplanes ianthinogenes]|uniref:DUF4367 domain-containing protein n=1 Tax=Actinoplanes ianthinogenes TaxID=122358 RepID=A0ABM7LNN2_9ACTN|nr:hypothetical protein [Actinoplanes ianthinogenes]BCJ40810.1 hypothetical protein Aiant_14670 [Actinoplanes ianthinogenes]GGR25048.1 hypothetical protein GCM10010168_48910 [Actinoplanes ianthinogenes]
MTDDDLRDRVRRADPAASLAPLPPARLARLVEDTMTNTVVSTPVTRRRRTALLAAAVVVLLAAAGGWFLLRPAVDGSSKQVAVEPLPAISVGVIKLGLAGVAAKCVEPSAPVLKSRADLAFAATVRDVEGERVTLQVTRVYLGNAGDLVEVDQPGGSEGLVGRGAFVPGEKYLVAAVDGDVMICGYSGSADAPGLQEMFDEAF